MPRLINELIERPLSSALPTGKACFSSCSDEALLLEVVSGRIQREFSSSLDGSWQKLDMRPAAREAKRAAANHSPVVQQPLSAPNLSTALFGRFYSSLLLLAPTFR